jgi:hypothetical protein
VLKMPHDCPALPLVLWEGGSECGEGSYLILARSAELLPWAGKLIRRSALLARRLKLLAALKTSAKVLGHSIVLAQELKSPGQSAARQEPKAYPLTDLRAP